MMPPEPTSNFIVFFSSGLFSFLMSIFAGVSGVEASFAFAGAVVFVISSKELKLLEKIALFIVSFLVGIHTAELFATVLTEITPKWLVISKSIGAFLSAAFSVNVVMFTVTALKNPLDFANKIIALINKFRGKENHESE